MSASSSSSASLLSETELCPVDRDSMDSNEVEEMDRAKELGTGQEVEAVRVSEGSSERCPLSAEGSFLF